jgi:hypothetical protein
MSDQKKNITNADKHTNAYKVSLSTRLERTPFCCPVCGGNGLKDRGFYATTTGQWSSSAIEFIACKTCGGTGIVWSVSG